MRFFLAAICVGLLTGCASRTRLDDSFEASLSAPYQLDSGDRVRLIVFGQEDLSNSFSVDGAGLISLPLIGSIPARGLTTRELEASIEARLRQGYLRDPRATAEVEIFRPFFALGEVNTPGRYAYVHGMTGRHAVAIAGGFSPRARTREVRIVRQYRGQQIEAVVPLDHPIRPGDTVTAIERWF